ncbi:single-stranded-DNA-specific exonuclease RecJ [Thioalkalivibrio sp. XN8]|uniref:single-stranded-DNA-specific exonuclease RecJ n=1 Tax=Thioalkalivibrio sp. XN8 TaxID=2712863 RepID=UPI001981F7B7|nr:single-stranded-DNA-specific exonuclease RecJ [Thioalkalivibrio sp. XN8]
MLKRRPIRRREVAPAALASLQGVPSVLARLYAARGLRDPGELDLALAGLAPVGSLEGVEDAAALVARHLAAGSRILVVGDFDADGATSTALLLRVLRALGGDVGYLVPDRFVHGYGLSPALVQQAAEGAPPALLITVDSGINCHPGVRLAIELGMEVLVTDHHLPGEQLPPATAIVNPAIPGQGFPSRCLAGVGVAFYLAAALARQVGAERGLVPGLLDLVALGTVADLVPLDRNNRILVEHGLKRIRAGACRPGIEALLRAGNRDPRQAVTTDLAFAAGPRLNAAGRLDDMSVGIECLLSDDPGRAAELAGLLSGLNEERKQIEAQMQQEALQAVGGLELAAERLPPVLCVYRSGWHSGVVGLVAARLKERYHRPVVAFARDDSGLLKGSARSVSGLHIRDALADVDAACPGLIERFGGHAMAAGLTLAPAALDEFTAALEAAVGARIEPGLLDGEIVSDGELPEEALGLATAELLRDAAPWGQGFPEPVFDGVFELLDSRIVGLDHLKLRVRPAGGRRVLDAIAFRQADRLGGAPPRRLRLAYRLGVNEYAGVRSAQLVVEYLEPA